jgi:hypothetical protein
MANFQKFNAFVNSLAIGTFNLSTDALKIMLTDVAPVATNSVKADLTEIAAGNGYSTGGASVTTVSSGQTGGTYKLVVSQPVFTATGGSIAQFRYAVIYDSTPGSGPLIGFWDYGAEVNITVGNTFQVQTDQTNGILQIV